MAGQEAIPEVPYLKPALMQPNLMAAMVEATSLKCRSKSAQCFVMPVDESADFQPPMKTDFELKK
ncbi:MAG: hypothetical protein EB069_04545 [Actinobacteria bacterium]|nr:hypothetical protein [Actinomycetota bacterium]